MLFMFSVIGWKQPKVKISRSNPKMMQNVFRVTGHRTLQTVYTNIRDASHWILFMDLTLLCMSVFDCDTAVSHESRKQ